MNFLHRPDFTLIKLEKQCLQKTVEKFEFFLQMQFFILKLKLEKGFQVVKKVKTLKIKRNWDDL